jgi:DNA polymerase-3 subunit gamma/tau
VEETDVREMLGLVDRTKIISLFKEVLSGKEKEAIKYLRELINDGIDANFFLNDMLEILYLFSRRINLGPIEKDMTISENETELVDAYSKNIDMQDIGLFWQLTIKTIDDLKIVGNENIALEMYIMQLVHLKNIDAQKIVLEENVLENNIELKNNLVGENIKEENLKNDLSAQIKKQLKSTDQIKVNPVKNLSPETSSDKVDIKNFSDLMNLVNREKEVELKFDLERNVKLVSFNKGKIDISFNENLNKNLTEKLLLWSGERWIISLSKNTEAKSIYEQNIEQKSLKLMEFKKSELAKTFEDAFPDAKLTNIEGEKDD